MAITIIAFITLRFGQYDGAIKRLHSHLSMPSGDAPMMGRDPSLTQLSISDEYCGRRGMGSLNASSGNIPRGS